MPVTISSTMFVESCVMNVENEMKKMGMNHDWKINDRLVDEFKVKCKFKNTKLRRN